MNQKLRDLDSPRTLIFIHIGKCGGSTLRRALRQSPILRARYERVLTIHVQRPPILSKADYLVVIRNPIARLVSAFNWRYHLVVETRSQQGRFEGEYEILKKYGNLNELARNLYARSVIRKDVADDFETVHHIRERISYYMETLLQSISPNQLRYVIAQETLDDDIFKILRVRNKFRLKNNRHTNSAEETMLSPHAYHNLRRYVADDYEAIEKILSISDTTIATKTQLLK